MKIPNQDGEFAFKALIPYIIPGGAHGIQAFKLSEGYFLTHPKNGFIWPVELLDKETVYIPDPSELE